VPQEFDSQRPHLGAHCRHLADNLVAGNEGILADAPVVGNQMKVTVADGAVGNRDLHFLQAQLTGIVLERQ